MFVDPLAEQTMEPYSYVGNNPIMFTDPTGMSAEPPPGTDYEQGHRHTDEEGTQWQLNGRVWENQSGGEDQWQSETLPEMVIEADRATDYVGVAKEIGSYLPGGGAIDIYDGIKNGNNWQVGLGVASLVADAVSFGTGGFLVKGGAKALLKAGAQEAIEQSAEKVVKEGIYDFVSASGKRYIGQSKNIPKRLKQHIKSGKLIEGTPVETIEVLGGKTAREVQEQLRINAAGGIKNLENVRNPIGPSRQHLLPKK